MLWSAASSTSDATTAGSGNRGMSNGTRKRAATTVATTSVSVPIAASGSSGRPDGTSHQRGRESARGVHPQGVTRSAVEAQLAPDLRPRCRAAMTDQDSGALFVIVDLNVVVEP